MLIWHLNPFAPGTGFVLKKAWQKVFQPPGWKTFHGTVTGSWKKATLLKCDKKKTYTMCCFNLLASIKFHRSCACTHRRPHNISPLLEAVTLISGKPLQSHIDHVASLGIGGQHSQWRDTDSHAGRLWLQSATVLHSHRNKTMRKVTWGQQNGKSPESEEKERNLSTFNGPKSSETGWGAFKAAAPTKSRVRLSGWGQRD